MGKIAVVTDSTCDIPINLIKKYGIEVVPLSVIFGEDTYVDDGEKLTIEEFYKKLKSAEKLPTTTQPTPQDFQEVYEKLLKGYETIISIHISKKMSGTINSAETAKKQLPGKDIEIIDSELVHMPLGFIVLRVAKMVEGGKSREEILKSVDEIRKSIRVLFIPMTLDYLRKGGRIGKAKGLIASLLEIKPILTLHDGEVSQYKTTRRWKQAKTELIASMETMVKNPGNLVISVGDADLKEEGDEMLESLKEKFNPREIFRVNIGTIVGTHLGPGIGITFYEE